MKIVCPSCDAAYEVPELVITSRRKMRCARCGTEWVPADALGAAVAAPLPDIAQQTEAGGAPATAAFAGHTPDMPAAEPPASQTADLPAMDISELALAVLVEDVPAKDPVLPEPVITPKPLALRPETPMTIMAAPAGAAAVSPVTKQVQPPAPGIPVLAWVASIAVLVAALAAGVMFRTPIMKAWPPSQRLYAVVGLADR